MRSSNDSPDNTIVSNPSSEREADETEGALIGSLVHQYAVHQFPDTHEHEGDRTLVGDMVADLCIYLAGRGHAVKDIEAIIELGWFHFTEESILAG
jgi:hypothetical protein